MKPITVQDQVDEWVKEVKAKRKVSLK